MSLGTGAQGIMSWVGKYMHQPSDEPVAHAFKRKHAFSLLWEPDLVMA